MIFDAEYFVFNPPLEVSFARRVLVKPKARYALPHPVTTSRETLAAVIEGIRRVSDADIIFLEGSPDGGPMGPIYAGLGYEFPRVNRLDVRDCTLVEVENPLSRPFALPTFWVPNVVLSCDFLISVAPFQVIEGSGSFAIENMLGLIPAAKYRAAGSDMTAVLQRLGLHNVIADFYFTLPFDLGIVDGRRRLVSGSSPTKGEADDYGKIFIGDPYEVDSEASRAAVVETEYLRLIGSALTGPHI